MEKYHIYEEVGSGQHSQVFKGREKMDIEYVAIKRVEKSRMDSVVNEVQVIHRLSSPNVLKFYDWYETRNNVWLVLEFCTGGDLLTLIKQDHREPESAVRLFGVDLLAGLQQTHASGYLHGDLRPSNVLIDEHGILKLSGFGLARGVASEKVEGEGSVGEGGDGDRGGGGGDRGIGNSRGICGEMEQQRRTSVNTPAPAEVGAVAEGRDPKYMAPELFSLGEEAMSFASDFWSLGCVLYELLIGEPPFRSSSCATVAETIAREHPPGLDKGEWQGARMSAPFRDLVSWLLQKDPHRRPTWPQLLAHPFWGNCQTPSPLEMPPQPRFDGAVLGAACSAATTASAKGVVEADAASVDAAAGAGAEEVHNTANQAQQQQQQQEQQQQEQQEQQQQQQQQQRQGTKEGGGRRGVGQGLASIGIVEAIADSPSVYFLRSSSSFSSPPTSAEGLASISTIDSNSHRRRERRGVTGEWHGSFLSTEEELPGEMPEMEDSSRQGDGGREREREEEGETADNQFRDQGYGSREGAAKLWRVLDGAATTDSARRTGREEGDGEELSTPPSGSIPGTTATERWRSGNNRRLPQNQQRSEKLPRAQQHGRDNFSGDRRIDGHQMGGAPGVSPGEGAGLEAAEYLPPAVVVPAAGSKAEDQHRQKMVERQEAPCHDGVVVSRGGGETATATTAVPGNASSGAISRVSVKSESIAVDDAVGDADNTSSSSAAAKRAAATEALNGLRLRGRIPPLRRGGGGAGATRGRGGGTVERTGGRMSPSASSVTSVVSVASSSVGEQYGSSFEEDTEGSSSCSAAGGGGCGAGGWGSETAGVVPVVVASGSEGMPKLMGGSGDSDYCQQNAGYFVMTPGSVGTETTATPSSAGVASSSRRGRGPSSGGGDGRRLDRTMLPTTGSSGSVGSGCSDTALATSSTTRGEGAGGGNDFAATALSFRRAAGCYSYPASERVPTSLWTLSAGASGVRRSREVVDGAHGVEGEEKGCSEGASRTTGRGSQVTTVAPAVEFRGRTPPSNMVSRADAGAATISPRSGVADWGLRAGGGPAETRRPASSPSADGNGSSWGSKGRRPPPPPPPPPEAVGTWGAAGGRQEGSNDVFEGRGGGVQRGAKETVGGPRAGDLGWDESIPVDRERDGGSPVIRGVRELLLHTSDAQVTPIVGCRSGDSGLSSSASNYRLRQSASRVDQLPFEALLPGTVSTMPPPQLEAHLTLTYNALTEASASVRQKGQTLVYLQSLAPIPRVSNLLVNSTFLLVLLRLLRAPRPAAIRDTVATLIGLLVRHATYITPGAGRAPSGGGLSGGGGGGADRKGAEAADGGGLMSVLIATADQRPVPGRAAQTAALRRNTVAALGELLFYIVTQEPVVGSGGGGGSSVYLPEGGERRETEADRWTIPVAAVGDLIGKCLLVVDATAGGLVGHEGVQHYAAKTLENVLAQVGPLHPLVSAFVTPELASGLLDLARHASSESLRCTAAAGLSHLLGHDILGGECSRGWDDFEVSSDASSTAWPRSTGEWCGGSESVGRGGRRGARRRIGNGDADEPGAGWIASRVMCEPGVPEAIVQGLSTEGSSAASRRAFLGIFNLVVWASRNGGGRGGRTFGGGWSEVKEDHGFKRRCVPLGRAVESMLGSQHLLLRLLRVAEHGEGAVLRAKGFLALRLTLEAANPAFLLKACRSRLLPLLARVIGGLAPRSAARGLAAATVAVPELSPQQEYLYECSTKLAEWLCAIPETAARRLVTELRRRCAAFAGSDGITTKKEGHGVGQQQRQRQRTGRERRLATRQQVDATSAAGTAELETAMAMFPAVVHLVNSPLLREEAVTGAFVSDIAGCLSLSCPNTAPYGRGTTGGGSGRRAVLAAGVGSLNSSGDGSTEAVVLAALLPTVETLAQQAELVLVRHRGVVSAELIPVLCRFLTSPSGDTRALVVAIFRVLLPPLVQQQQQSDPLPPSIPPQFQDGLQEAPTASFNAEASTSLENLVRSAFAGHLLPLASNLLRDHDPIPQYTIRLLLDVGRAWRGLGPALLASDRGAAFAALLDRLSRPLSVGHSPGGVQPGHEPAEDAIAVTALDPALPALLTLLVDGGGQACFVERGMRGAGPGPGWPGAGHHRQQRMADTGDVSSFSHGEEDVFVALLQLELPRRTAAVVAAAVKTRVPATTDAYLGLAVALLDAGARRKSAAESLGAEGDVGLWKPSRAAAMTAAKNVGARASAAGRRWEERLLKPLLAAVPASVEGVTLFYVQDALAKKRREQQLVGTKTRGFKRDQAAGGALGGVDEVVRSGVSDSATLFWDMCYKVFGDFLLRSLLLLDPARPSSGGGGGGGGQEPLYCTAEATARQARVCRQLADFLGCPDDDERPRTRVLNLLLSAVSTLGQNFRTTLRQGPLWTALLRLATGRGMGTGGGGGGAFRGATPMSAAGGDGDGGAGASAGERTVLGAASALARDVIAAVREDIGYCGPAAAGAHEPRRWSGRSASSGSGRR